jgi:hypothetical protein
MISVSFVSEILCTQLGGAGATLLTDEQIYLVQTSASRAQGRGGLGTASRARRKSQRRREGEG